jgi:hypothetical protein
VLENAVSSDREFDDAVIRRGPSETQDANGRERRAQPTHRRARGAAGPGKPKAALENAAPIGVKGFAQIMP